MIFDSLRFYSLQPVFYQPAVYPFGIQLSHPQASIPFQHRRTLRHTTSSGPHQVLENGLDFTLDVHSLPQISNGASTQHIEAQQQCVVRSQQHYRSVEGSDPSLQSSKLSLRATRFVFPTEDAHFKNEEANGETSFSLDYKVIRCESIHLSHCREKENFLA